MFEPFPQRRPGDYKRRWYIKTMKIIHEKLKMEHIEGFSVWKIQLLWYQTITKLKCSNLMKMLIIPYFWMFEYYFFVPSAWRCLSALFSFGFILHAGMLQLYLIFHRPIRILRIPLKPSIIYSQNIFVYFSTYAWSIINIFSGWNYTIILIFKKLLLLEKKKKISSEQSSSIFHKLSLETKAMKIYQQSLTLSSSAPVVQYSVDCRQWSSYNFSINRAISRSFRSLLTQ